MKETWAKLSLAIREIQNHNASKLSFEEHYRYAYNMVLFKREFGYRIAHDGGVWRCRAKVERRRSAVQWRQGFDRGIS